MVELPYDIWLHIASVTDAATIRSLYSLNRAFFHISMKAKYKAVCVASPPGLYTRDLDPFKRVTTSFHEFAGNLTSREIFRDPGVAHHVQTLCILSGSFRVPARSHPISVHKNKKTYNVLKSLWKLAPGFGRTETPPVTLYKIPFHLISAMNAIREMHVETRYWGVNTPFVVQLFGAALQTSQMMLTSLDIKVQLTQIEEVIPPHLKLPSLRNFTVQIEYGADHRSPMAHTGEIMSRRLLPFIDAHRRTLVSFGLNSLDDGNLSSLLQRLPYMPFLHTLNLMQGGEGWGWVPAAMETLYSKYSTVLTTYQSQLRHLSLEMTPMRPGYINLTSFFQMTWCRVPLPNLESLTLVLPSQGLLNDTSTLGSYLQQHTSSLAALTIRECALTPQQLESVLVVFRISDHLQNLELEVRMLKPDTFTAIATSLPNLDYLKLIFVELSREDYDLEPTILIFPPPTGNLDDSDWALFLKRMLLNSRMSNWKLRSLDLRATDTRFTMPHRFKKALAHIFPNVQEFCGLSRPEYKVSNEDDQPHSWSRNRMYYFARLVDRLHRSNHWADDTWW